MLLSRRIRALRRKGEGEREYVILVDVNDSSDEYGVKCGVWRKT